MAAYHIDLDSISAASKDVIPEEELEARHQPDNVDDDTHVIEVVGASASCACS